jgi:hypothetical protein
MTDTDGELHIYLALFSVVGPTRLAFLRQHVHSDCRLDCWWKDSGLIAVKACEEMATASFEIAHVDSMAIE